MTQPTPAFAVVGAVNPGKSSIVSTLAENDRVVSSTPGATRESARFTLEDLFVFYDTPGFQNAFAALEELTPASNTRDPLQVFRDFIARHREEAAFEAECVLLKTIVDGAGILYVVDGSKPLLDINIAEMEILRLTGRPRVAVINRTGPGDHVSEWKSRLDQHFKIVWEFDAQRATFADRIELLDLLAGVEQDWAPKIRQAVQILREDRKAKINESAEIIVEMLSLCLQHRASSMEEADSPARQKQLDEKLKAKYQREVSEIEAAAHRQLIQKFKHSLVEADANLIEAELFNEETWKFLGLTVQQLMFYCGLAGGFTGSVVDVGSGGHTLGLGTVIGAIVGAGGALIIGKVQPELAVEVPLDGKWVPKFARPFLPRKFDQRVSGRSRVVRCAAADFPWILLDRAVGAFVYASQRAHGRRDRAVLRPAQLKAVLDAHKISSTQMTDKASNKIFEAIRKEKLTPEQRVQLREKIRDWLEKAEKERIDFATANFHSGK